MEQSKTVLKLNQEDREAVEELLQFQGWNTTVKFLEQLVRKKGESVLSSPVTESGHELKAARLKYEGAKELLHDIKNLKQRLNLRD